MKGDRAFFDTNILIYAFALNDPRTDAAENLLARGGVVAVQTLNEFVAVAQRKLGMSWKEVLEALDAILVLCPKPIPLTLQVHQKGLQIAKQHRYRIYDSLMIAAALQGACHTFFSEDMRHGQVIDTLTIRNPFL